ncbi:ankyrin [Coprinellus micaceus]|uniref:Ankyrin n=1 Tax=Coprinellus micaceus TaxID=71717 RepID=A0A4Y7SRC8_COPMI|nr:ankyrin [Coprinellus micaceus]
MVVKAVSTPQPLPLKTKSEPGGYTPFHVAAMYGRFENFQLLPSSYSGADVLSEGGRTVLHVAVEYHQISFIKRLRDLAYQPRGQQLEPGAFGFDPCALDSEGVTPLMLASHDGKEEVVRMLLSCEGVDGNFRNGRGETVLHYATRYQDPVGNLTFNIGRHGDIEEQDRMAKFLCSIPHIDVNARDNEGNSPFMLACQSGLEGTVEYILDNFDARPPFSHQINNQGQTAMMLVCHAIAEHGHGDAAIKILVASGSDLHAQDSNGITPFLGILKWHSYQEFYPEGRTVKLLTELLSLDRPLWKDRAHNRCSGAR